MACFASYRRSGLVRLLVVILCALFIFATLGAPPAQALGVESVAVFGLASVLSAATAALGFKLASNEQGQATLQKMVQDFKTVAWATGFVLVGSKLNGLQNGMDYIKMQVQNGKTYLDSRVFAWVQQWLAENGVYDSGSIVYPDYVSGGTLSPLVNNSFDTCFSALIAAGCNVQSVEDFKSIVSYFSLTMEDGYYYSFSCRGSYRYVYKFKSADTSLNIRQYQVNGKPIDAFYVNLNIIGSSPYYYAVRTSGLSFSSSTSNATSYTMFLNPYIMNIGSDKDFFDFSTLTGAVSSGNDTGLSGTDTLGKDVVDLTLDQVLQKLKEWAQDWFDAGADSATNAATGALDLPLTVSAGAATANPSIAEDGPLVWFPPFSVPIPTLRTGETDTKTVDQGKENASAVETSTVDVAENQTVIDSLVNWALSYISPDTGLFSKFPLCVPYDAYLLVTSSLGVDAVGSDSIFGASPGDLEGVVSQDIETYSDFQPIINIKHDFELDGVMYPLDVTIDLTPWQPFVTFFREGMALLLIAELIGSEFKRIRGH